MASTDHTDQYAKLRDLYGEMSDSRLLEMANQIDDLTEVAQEVLRAEISTRGLDKKKSENQGERPLPSEDELVAVWWAKDKGEMDLILDVLESAGIPAVQGVEKFELVDGGFEEQPVVRVLPESRLRALEVLRQNYPQEPEPADDRQHLVVCPKCQSPEIVFQNLEPQSGASESATFNWSCDACGHAWRDDGLAQLA